MSDSRTHTWSSVIAFYRGKVAEAPQCAAMAQLVEQLATSRYATGLHPVTSHLLLRLFAHDRFAFDDDQIQVEHDGTSFTVRYVSVARVQSHAPAPIRSDWVNHGHDGFGAVDRCLDHLKWFVEERSSASRPAV